MNITWIAADPTASDAEAGIISRHLGRVGDRFEYVIIGRRSSVFQAYTIGQGGVIIAAGLRTATLEDATIEAEIFADETAAAADAFATDTAEDENTGELLAAGIADAPTRRAPVTVDEAMAQVLHIARRLDLPTDPHQALPIGDLADLLCKLGDAVRAHGAMLSSRVVAAQHAERLTRDRSDPAKVIADASAETVRDSESARMAALGRLGDAIITYGHRD